MRLLKYSEFNIKTKHSFQFSTLLITGAVGKNKKTKYKIK